MKKFLTFLAVFGLIACVGLVILYQFKDELGFYNPTVAVNAVFMVQDPDTGEYERLETNKFRISKDKPYTYEALEREHYTINEERSVLSVERANSATQFVVYYDCQTCKVTFRSDRGVLSEGQSEIIVRKGQTITNVAKFSCDGYEHIGYSQEIGKVYEDSAFDAVWQLKQFSVYLYVLSGDKVLEEGYKRCDINSNCYVKTFDFTQTFTLPELEVQSSEQTFNGWFNQLNGEGERYYEVELGRISDLHLYADYDVMTYELSFMLDDECYSTSIAEAGEKIYSAGILAEDQIAGMGLNWYEDRECETLYKFDLMPQGGVTVYGKWEEDIGKGFIGWSPQGETIDSYEELLKYAHYVRFNNLTSDEQFIEVTYCSLSQLEGDVDLAIGDLEFRTSGISTCASGKEINGKTYVCFYMERDNGYEYAELESTQKNDTKVYEYFGETKGERDNGGDFYIDSLPVSYKVETTIQLQYVVERGYRPECKQYSPAQKVYDRAREILNSIISEDFNDYEKVQAIYDWFVLNVQYDFNATEHISDWHLYDAHYMEGVFFNQKAVCDGIAKAFSLMCNIEGIPCLEVGGKSHAWCKVKVNNEWYVVDATHGRVHLNDSNMAMVTHGEIFISDEEKAASGYEADEHPNIVANSSYDYFANKLYTYNGETHDYVIENADEFANLLAYISESAGSLTYLQIELRYRVTGMKIEQTFMEAVQKLNLMGIDFGYTMQKCFLVESSQIAHILFE